MRAKLLLLTILFVGISKNISAQDLHYSQFYNAPSTISPALTGIFNGDQRVSVSVRDQWRSVPVPWFTATIAYDQKYYSKKSKNSFFGIGGSLNYDRQGNSNLTLTNLNLSGSYNYVINSNNVISLGLLVGFATRGFDVGNLTWDKQWDGLQFVPGSSGGEDFDLQRVALFENGAGLNYRLQLNKRTKIDLGVGGFHLIAPDVTYTGSSAVLPRLPRRFSAYGIGSIGLTDKLDFQVDGMAQFQGPYREYLIGGYLNYFLNRQAGKSIAVRAGVGYRTSQALYPKVALQYNQVFVAFSYDIDLSEFSQHTSGRGGPELHFQYLITHVKPMGQFKVCPIF